MWLCKLAVGERNWTELKMWARVYCVGFCVTENVGAGVLCGFCATEPFHAVILSGWNPRAFVTPTALAENGVKRGQMRLNAVRMTLLLSFSFTKMRLKCGQNAVKMRSNTAEIQLKCGQTRLECGWNAVKMRSEAPKAPPTAPCRFGTASRAYAMGGGLRRRRPCPQKTAKKILTSLLPEFILL